MEKESLEEKINTETPEELALKELSVEEQLIKMTEIALTFKKEIEKLKEEKEEVEVELASAEIKLRTALEVLDIHSNQFATFISNLPTREDYLGPAQILKLAIDKLKDL